MSLLYEVRGLVRRYGRVTALDLPALGVDELRIHSGQVLTLVGYNGSGKSTLLRLLAFLEEPDEGRIIYHGGEDPRREVSLLLQEPYLLKTTVFENVVLGLKLRGRRDGQEEAYQAAMRQVGFDDPDAMRRRGPNALSGGGRGRVGLAARLGRRPRGLRLGAAAPCCWTSPPPTWTCAAPAPSPPPWPNAGPKVRPSSVPPTIPRSCRLWAGNSSNWARAGAWRARSGTLGGDASCELIEHARHKGDITVALLISFYRLGRFVAGLAADHHVTVMAVEKRNTLLSRIGGQKRVSFSGGVWPVSVWQGRCRARFGRCRQCGGGRLKGGPAGWGLRFGRLQKVDDRTVVQIRELLQAFQTDRVVAFFHAADGLGFQSQQMGRFFLGEACLLAPQLQVMGCDHDDVFGHVVFL